MQLVVPIVLREAGRKHRFVQPATEELHLAPRDQRREALQELGALRRQPLEQRARVVEREPDARVALQRLEHGEVGAVVDLGEDPAEVAHRLVVVDRQGQGDAGGHDAVLCALEREEMAGR